MKVTRKVASKWEQVAWALHVTPEEADIIKRDNPLDCVLACEKVLQHWMNEETRCPVTWRTLLDGLRESNFITLANDLEEALLYLQHKLRTCTPFSK